ncbi:MAG: tRNA modification GTPase [Thermoguttaceae bacterium]
MLPRVDMYPLDDTIAAIATPPGGAARGIVRLSGPQAIDCVRRLFYADDSRPLAARQFPCALTGSLHLPGVEAPLPCDVYLWCRRPARDDQGGCKAGSSLRCDANDALQRSTQVHSYTGQPVAEIHTLGSPPLLQLVLRSLCDAGARLAGPGEFTLRAFLAGRIDLGQAEAVLGVIDAANPEELRLALGQLAGGLARPLHCLRESLLELLAHIEAGFDFADEDLPFISLDALRQRLADARTELAAVVRQMTSRNDAALSPRAVLLGRPNSGKSSLWNALVGEPSAIVSDQPGTTRDYLTVELALDGVRCQLVDTAGMSADSDSSDGQPCDANSAAQSVSVRQHQTADIEVLCLDATQRPDQQLAAWPPRADRQRIITLTKCDLCPGVAMPDALCTSGLTGEGIDALRDALRSKAIAAQTGGALAATALRCGESLRLVGESLERAQAVAAGQQEELVAVELRAALEELGKVTGAIHTEDVLDRIFSRFCVGK